MCRRCGAPLHSGPEATRVAVPSSLHRRSAGGPGVATPTRAATAPGPAAAAAAAAATYGGPPGDTLLPGALPRPDNLLPRATRQNATRPNPTRQTTARQNAAAPAAARRSGPAGARTLQAIATIARDQWRRVIVLVVVAVALTMSVVAVWPVVFSHGSGSPASSVTSESRATGLLRTVVGGGRMLYASHKSFAGLTPARLSEHSYKVTIVGPAAVAHRGQVSVRATRGVLIVATPADAHRCVFARDEPAKSLTQFVTTATAACRAAAAPAQGWTKR